ncbi:hypothetical protein IC608_11220 [Devosia sp. PTR5]|uniref:TniQ protein n=1 Tax=Devosia oryzisoli TaxID=2774138 RepID=A0A927FWC4_9HYPH|nr:hypothetical protein [Devosia oryzisoli]MBD8066043.1 hypothetical protein [Devosia oryzisoli]
MPDENLAGLVARAASVNVYPHARDVLALADVGSFRPESIAMQSAGTASGLAQVLGTNPDLLQPLYYPARGDRHIDFFGTNLRAKHREPLRRRLSPRALCASPYIKAVWSLRPLTFDPSTKEILLSACPVCGNDLGFTRTWGVEFCEHCVGEDEYGLPVSKVDLRDFPQELVEVADEAALDFVTALIDPDPERRRGTMPSLHDSLSVLDRGQLFELAVAIGAALMLNHDTQRPLDPTNINRGRIRGIEPSALAAAGRAIITWPRGFLKLCEAQAASVDRRGNKWGIHKELGALGNLRRDPHLDLDTKDIIASATASYFRASASRQGVPRNAAYRSEAYVGAKELCAKFNVDYGLMLKVTRHPDVFTMRGEEAEFSPLNLMKWQGEAILRNYKQLVSESTLGWRLGLPVDAIQDFASSLWLKPAQGVEATLTLEGRHYHGSDITDLFDYYVEIFPRVKKQPGYVTFGEAMLMFPAGRRPWFPLWEDIFYNRVNSFLHKEPTRGVTEAVSVRASDIDRERLLKRLYELPAPDLDRVTIGNANLMLGIYVYPVFTACVEAGLLSVDADKMVPYAQVMEFAGKYVLTNEIGIRSGRSRLQLRNWLAVNGVQPAIDLEVKGGLLYDRAKVEPLL